MPRLLPFLFLAEVAKYIVVDEATTAAWARLLERYPTRFLFGTDSVAPQDQQAYLKTYVDYQPLWDVLSPETRDLMTRGNYARLFDAANEKVRAWERAALASAQPGPHPARSDGRMTPLQATSKRRTRGD